MAITYRFEHSLNVFFTEMRGTVTDEELLQYAKAATTDIDVSGPYHELVDLREVQVPAASTEALRRVAATFSDGEQAPEGVRIAFVASSDAAFGLARMYQAFRAGSQASFHVFRDMAKAREWLGLPPEPDA